MSPQELEDRLIDFAVASMGVAGVALPGALARKMPRAGEKPGWHQETGDDPRAEACVRHRFDPRWNGHQDLAGIVRPRGCEDDGDLHACGERHRSDGGEKPAGPLGVM